ncbi:MAG: glycosyltransferase family 4 protein [Muribaculaceae bacterium]|nr:glycosyltransferase family 4 protein [Muribaculaceae bacterium]
MKIGFDAKRAILNYTGLGNYSRLAIDVVSSAWPDNKYILYTPRRRHNDRMADLLHRQCISVSTPDTLSGRILSQLWRSKGITGQLVRDGIDLYHGLSNELPAGIASTGIASVVTIHDVIFIPHPEFYHRADVVICRRKFGYAAKVADRIIAISECTRRDIVDHYGVDPGKIDVVYQGCHPSFYMPLSAEAIGVIKKKYMLPQRYIVAVGTVEARKNALLAVKALRGLPADVTLVIIGRRTDYARLLDDEIAASGLQRRVRFVEGVPFADLPALYAGSVFASYTSFYEGFGIPVIEAVASGVPVIAATGSCLEEAGGPGAMYVNPRDTDQYVTYARMLLDDAELRRRMVDAGRAYITRFSFDNFADGLTGVYRKALQSK